MATKKNTPITNKNSAPVKKSGAIKKTSATAKTAKPVKQKTAANAPKARKGYAEYKKWFDGLVAGFDGLTAAQQAAQVKDIARQLALGECQRAVDYRKYLADIHYSTSAMAMLGLKGSDELEDGYLAVSDALDGSELDEVVRAVGKTLSEKDAASLNAELRREEVRLAFMVRAPY